MRAAAVGLSSVLLGVHLARAGLDASSIGLIVGVGLAGMAVGVLVVTLWGDRLGRRRSLVAVATIAAAGGCVFLVTTQVAPLCAAAFVGAMNGMGRDRGASAAIESSILPSLVLDARRTRWFAGYTVMQDAGGAVGNLCAGLPVLLAGHAGVSAARATQATFGVYVLLFLVAAACARGLSHAVELGAGAPRRVSLSPESRRILTRISALFSLDSLGGGFLTSTILTYFFVTRFGANEGAVGALFACAGVLSALSHFGAAWLAARIGLVNTMVFTHIPSSLLLVTVGIAPTFAIAAALFLLRQGLVEMDVPTRQSYVMAVMKPEERTIAAGVTSLVRVAMWAIAPAFAGLFMQRIGLAVPLLIAAALKITYDLLLYAAFRGLKPPEEMA